MILRDIDFHHGEAGCLGFVADLRVVDLVSGYVRFDGLPDAVSDDAFCLVGQSYQRIAGRFPKWAKRDSELT